MDKKEIYEHLAKIYLDASCKSSKKKKEIKAYPKRLVSFLIAGLTITCGLGGGFLSYNLNKNAKLGRQVALYLIHDAAKINFNFDPAKKELFSLNLKGLNIAQYHGLSFDVRKSGSRDRVSLRVEFTNGFNEKGEVYIKDIPQKWSNYRFDFSRFKGVNYWQDMKALAFCVEEWNAQEKSGVVYIDNVRLEK